MPDDDRTRRRLDDLPQSLRLVLAVAGFALGLLLVFVGARSCETSLNETPPSTVPVGGPVAGTSG